MKKIFTIALLRDLEKQVSNGEISYSRMVEILNEKANEAFGIWLVEANKSTGKIFEGRKYQVIEQVKDGLYIIDESGNSGWYSDDCFVKGKRAPFLDLETGELNMGDESANIRSVDGVPVIHFEDLKSQFNKTFENDPSFLRDAKERIGYMTGFNP